MDFGQLTEICIEQGEDKKSATSLSVSYLASLFVAVLLIGDPLIVPLVLIQSLLPILLGIIYDLSFAPQFVITSIVLYLTLLISLLTHLPTQFPLNDTSRIVLLLNVIFLVVIRF